MATTEAPASAASARADCRAVAQDMSACFCPTGIGACSVANPIASLCNGTSDPQNFNPQTAWPDAPSGVQNVQVEACQSAARILQVLGERELGWDYLTTPIGQRPAEAEPWVQLAGTPSRQGEQELAERSDGGAFGALVRGVGDRCIFIAHRILRDPGLAEDALQNALVLAWRRIPHLREPDRFEAWVHRILVHACYDGSQQARPWTANLRGRPVPGPAASSPVGAGWRCSRMPSWRSRAPFGGGGLTALKPCAVQPAASLARASRSSVA